MLQPHHEVFKSFKCWEGVVEPGYRTNFLGVKTRDYMARLEKKPSAQDGLTSKGTKTSLPDFDEEYFQWIDLAESVTHAQNQFIMIELGAGYGRWLANAAAMCRLRRIPFKLVGVEAEPTHFQWMKQHFLDNSLSGTNCSLVDAAVDTKIGDVRFLIGRPSKWYGQSTWPPETLTKIPLQLKLAKAIMLRRITSVRSVTLEKILEPFDRADLIDIDIQGSESRILSSAMTILDSKVRRVHIGTHSSTNEVELRSIFSLHDWECKFDYACGTRTITPYGKIAFQDGVQSWTNRRFGG